MINESIRYCPHCGEEHIVSPSYDTDGNRVGYFCNRVKLFAEAERQDTAIWNGEDISAAIDGFCGSFIDPQALIRLSRDRLPALAKRAAYAFLQTEYAKERRVNFAFAQYYAQRHAEFAYAYLTEGGE